MSFSFNSVDLDDFLDHRHVRDAMDVVESGRLPGMLGLGQSIVETWSKPRHDTWRPLWITRNSIQTVGHVHNYRYGQKPRKAPMTPFDKFCKDNNLVLIAALDHVSTFILTYAKESEAQGTTSASTETAKFTEEGRAIINTLMFAAPDAGSDIKVVVGSATHGRGMNEHIVTDGPYVDKDEDPTRVTAAISTMIWKHLGGSVQLIAQPRFNDDYTFSLDPLPPAGDYVDQKGDDNDSIELSLDHLANRCKAFMRARITRRVLLHGPPGTGKSTLAHRLASNMGNRVLRVDPRAFAKASQKNLTALVNVLRPNVFLLDDIDRRPGEAMELLSYFDDLKLDVIVVGTVNTLTTLDPALLRPGRFDEVLHVSEPTREHRWQIIQYYCSKHGVEFEQSMVPAMKGFSPADIQEVIRVTSVVDVSILDVEIARVRNQRQLYAGDACGEFLSGTSRTKKLYSKSSRPTMTPEDAPDDAGEAEPSSIGDNPDCSSHADCNMCPHEDYC